MSKDSEITSFVGYVLIQRGTGDGGAGELQAKRVFDTEPGGPVVGSFLDSPTLLDEDDEVVGVIPAADTEDDE